MEEEITKLIADKEIAEADVVRIKERHSRLQKNYEELQVLLQVTQDRASRPSKGDSVQVRTDAAIKSHVEQLQADMYDYPIYRRSKLMNLDISSKIWSQKKSLQYPLKRMSSKP